MKNSTILGVFIGIIIAILIICILIVLRVKLYKNSKLQKYWGKKDEIESETISDDDEDESLEDSEDEEDEEDEYEEDKYEESSSSSDQITPKKDVLSESKSDFSTDNEFDTAHNPIMIDLANYSDLDVENKDIEYLEQKLKSYQERLKVGKLLVKINKENGKTDNMYKHDADNRLVISKIIKIEDKLKELRKDND